MKVYLRADRRLSRAMFRVEAALARFAPPSIDVVYTPEEADLEVLHVIGLEAIEYQPKAPNVAVIQYCTNFISADVWAPLWKRAVVVWSYFDLAAQMPLGACFYRAPLGIDPVFVEPSVTELPRSIGLMTSGFLTGPGAEAIEEATLAAFQAGLTVAHLGPFPVGAREPFSGPWVSLFNASDVALAEAYQQTRWVSGLRHGEGFELPVIEGLSRGARPVVFDRPDMRDWYDGHAVFVPECHDAELVKRLAAVFAEEPKPVSADEHAEVLRKFAWSSIVPGFWDVVAKEMEILI